MPKRREQAIVAIKTIDSAWSLKSLIQAILRLKTEPFSGRLSGADLPSMMAPNYARGGGAALISLIAYWGLFRTTLITK